MTSTKNKIREEIKHNLRRLNQEDWLLKSQKIQTQLYETDAFKQSRCLFTYVSIDKEVDTLEIIRHSLRLGKQVVVPKVDDRQNNLKLASIVSVDRELKAGSFGIREPIDGRAKPMDSSQIDCAIVPGLAFDRQGNRLGRGKGYFDRFFIHLKQKITKIALAFDFQVLPIIPSYLDDRPVDFVISA